MARSVKDGDGTQKLDPDKVKSYVKRIEALHEEIASLTGEHMSECKQLREDIKSVVESAAADGIDPKALKVEVKVRSYKRKIKKVENDLEGSQVKALNEIRRGLGDLNDTPLGQAAKKAESKAKGEPDGGAADKKTEATKADAPKGDVVDLKAASDKRAGEENGRKIAEGIKQAVPAGAH